MATENPFVLAPFRQTLQPSTMRHMTRTVFEETNKCSLVTQEIYESPFANLVTGEVT